MSAPSYTPQLRPLSVGEILDAGFRLFRHRFGTLVALRPRADRAALHPRHDHRGVDRPDRLRRQRPGQQLRRPRWPAGLIDQLLSSVAAALAVAACFKAISAAYLGERAGAGESLRYAAGRFLPLIVAYIVIVIILIPAFIALIIPGIWIAVKLSMTFPAVVCEKAGPFTRDRPVVGADEGQLVARVRHADRRLPPAVRHHARARGRARRRAAELRLDERGRVRRPHHA